MLKNEVKINGRYKAKVSNKIVVVRIVRESRFGGWDAVNESTSREVRIRSAGKLREVVSEPKQERLTRETATRKREVAAAVDRAEATLARVQGQKFTAGTRRALEAAGQSPARTNELAKRATTILLEQKQDGLTLAEALDEAIMYLGDFIYNGAESGMQDDVNRVIGRLVAFIEMGDK